ncbi:MAG TPA: hypothetical protein VNH84_07835 [Candidatus Saccharimonadales bacterium]|nr:hypothetical protein [Candidatus Saccharimonadales bacterium]
MSEDTMMEKAGGPGALDAPAAAGARLELARLRTLVTKQGNSRLAGRPRTAEPLAPPGLA